MGRKRQSAGRGRGRGGRGEDAGHEGSGGRGRGRSRGGSGGRGREPTQPGETSRTGFVSGGALVDWENTTPNRRQSNGRGGRTSSNRRGSQDRAGVTRPAAQNNPFTFVSFDYTQLDRRTGGITSSASDVSLPEEVSAAVTVGDREVVIPAIEGRVEVYMDRKGCQEALEALESETRTTGLGFVDQESAGCTNPVFEAIESGNIADSELNVSLDRNVAVLEAMKVDTEPDNYIHLRNSDIHEENFRSGATNNRRGSSFETPSVKGRNAGYLSIGGVKVFTEAGITFSDESEDLDEELGLHSSSGKKSRRRKQAKQRGQWLEDTFSGSDEESIVDSSDDSDVDDDLVEDYLANVEGADEMLDVSWLLKKKLRQHVAVEDMGSEDSEDEDEDDNKDNTSTDNTSDHDSSDSGCASPERMWSLMKRQSKGKELMDIDDDDDDLDSELEDMAGKMLFGGSNARHVRKSKTASLLRNLELEDSEEDSEDEDDVEQLFDLMEDAHFMPDKMPKTPGAGKQASRSIGKSIEPMAWPLSVHKTKKKSKKVPGQKKRERKEMIAAKRQERALRRGLDLQAINSELEDIVLRGTDIYAFAPMEDRDRAQIHKMAAIYRLTSASQGSGKKRFTVVTRTKHTSLPTGADKYRLAAMLDQVDGNSSMPLTGEDRRIAKKFKNAARQAFVNMQTPTPTKRNGKKHQKLIQGEGFLRKSKSKKGSSGQNSTEKSGGKKLRTPKYANNPMSFISCGTIDNEEESATLGLGASISVRTEIESFSMSERGGASTSRSSSTVVKVKVAATSMPAAIGTFEAHTKGFGSRMMSKMGFVEGQGLGRDGQGINSPLEAVKRPKSLGLGAYAPPPAN